MGALVSRQRDDVRASADRRAREIGADRLRRSRRAPPVAGGAFISPILLRTDDPVGLAAVHDVEAFGPVSTIMPYRDLADAIALANRGMGSLALSLFTIRPTPRASSSQGAGAYHGRMLVIDRDQCRRNRPATARRSPVLVHGGPGRAGGSEEMGGVRGVKHYMQRTALQSTRRR
jgi:oxepin-CoA hydrolase/3-oxo-5,6-dehydrosuberyl-CoA semialdehyde dehydrogenase